VPAFSRNDPVHVGPEAGSGGQRQRPRRSLALGLALGLLLLAVGCGGAPKGVTRLEEGLRDTYGETDVGVERVSLKKPATAAIIMVDRTVTKRVAQRFTLAVGENAVVGRRRLVLVGVGGDDKNRYIDFRLEPIQDTGPEQSPTPAPPEESPPPSS